MICSLVSITLLYCISLCKEEMEERDLSPDLILDLQVHGGLSACYKLPRCLLSWFQVTPPGCLAGLLLTLTQRTWCFITLLYLSSWCAVWCAELLKCEAPGAFGIKKDWWYMHRPACQVDCPRPLWAAQRIDVKIEWLQRLVHCMKYILRCIPAQVKLSLKYFYDWWIDTDSQSGTNWTPPWGKKNTHPTNIKGAKSSKYNQGDNNQAFQFAVLFYRINQCLFY